MISTNQKPKILSNSPSKSMKVDVPTTTSPLLKKKSFPINKDDNKGKSFSPTSAKSSNSNKEESLKDGRAFENPKNNEIVMSNLKKENGKEKDDKQADKVKGMRRGTDAISMKNIALLQQAMKEDEDKKKNSPQLMKKKNTGYR